MIFQRVTQAVVVMLLGLQQRIKPVTRLCSTASCNLLDVVKSSLGISPTTADSPSHFNASSIVQSKSFSFLGWMKIILSGAILNELSAGGNMFWDRLIQRDIPDCCIRTERIPAINPPEAEISSLLLQINSCIAPSGKEELGKAYLIEPSVAFKSLLLVAVRLNPWRWRISFLRRVMISGLGVSINRIYSLTGKHWG